MNIFSKPTKEAKKTIKLKLPYRIEFAHQAIEKATEQDKAPLTDEASVELVISLLAPCLDQTRPRKVNQDGPNTKALNVLKKLDTLDFRGAAREFDSLPIASLNEKTKEELQQLYPHHQEDIPNMLDEPNVSSEALRVTPNQLKEALESMKISAPGRSRLTIGHLRQLMATDPVVLQAFTNVANIILLGGDLAEDPRLNKLTEARGIGLVKDLLTGKLRPIGINEAFLNLIARIGLYRMKDKILESFHENDYGFGKVGGTENVIQIARAIVRSNMRRGRPIIMLQLDFKNAFNSVFRKAIFEQIRAKCPELLPFARYRYRDLRVFFQDAEDGFVIASKAGVSQGCSLSPALFQMVMTEVLKEVRNIPGILALSYLDDVTIVASSLKEAWQAFLKVQIKASKIGLHLNLSKCTLFHWTPEDYALNEEEKTALRNFKDLGMEISSDGIKLLGAFIGTSDFIEEKTDAAFEEIYRRLDYFRELASTCEDPSITEWLDTSFIKQKMLRFVHWCLCPLPIYLMRVTPPRYTKHLARKFDLRLAICILTLASSSSDNLHPHPMTTQLWNEIMEDKLSFRSWLSYKRIFSKQAGLSLLSAEKSQIAANLGSIGLTAFEINKTLTKWDDSFSPAQMSVDLEYLNEQDWVIDLIVKHKTSPEDIHITPVFQPHQPRRGLQRTFYQFFIAESQMNERLAVSLFKNLSKEDEEVQAYAIKYARSRHHAASSWIFVPLSSRHLLLTNGELEAAIFRRIGEHPDVSELCALCNTDLTTETKPSEDHGVSCCAKHTGELSSAGNLVERCARTAIQYFDPSAIKTPRIDEWPVLPRIKPFHPTKEKDNTKVKGDILSKLCGRVVILDVYFANQLKSLIQLENSKISEYKVNRKYNPKNFVPFVVTSEGCWGPSADAYISELKETYKKALPLDADKRNQQAARRARETVSIGVCQANYRILHMMRYGKVVEEKSKWKRKEVSSKQKKSRGVSGETSVPSSDVAAQTLISSE